MRRYVKSQVEAVHLMKTQREHGMRILMKVLGAREEERGVIEKSYDSAMGEEVYPLKQYPSLARLKLVLDSIVKEEPKAAEAKPEGFVDARFVTELDASGYIDQLYKGKF